MSSSLESVALTARRECSARNVWRLTLLIAYDFANKVPVHYLRTESMMAMTTRNGTAEKAIVFKDIEHHAVHTELRLDSAHIALHSYVGLSKCLVMGATMTDS